MKIYFIMKLREMKEWINGIPEEYLDFDVINGEYGKLGDENYYRLDKPITLLNVDTETKEVLFLNESNMTPEEIEKELVTN